MFIHDAVQQMFPCALYGRHNEGPMDLTPRGREPSHGRGLGRPRYNKISCVSSPPQFCVATIQQDFLVFVADTIPRGNDTTKFLVSRCRGLARRQRNLRREGFSSPEPRAAATKSAPRRFFVAATLPGGNNITRFLSFRRRLCSAWQRYNKISCFSLPPLSRAAIISQDFLVFVAGA